MESEESPQQPENTITRRQIALLVIILLALGIPLIFLFLQNDETSKTTTHIIDPLPLHTHEEPPPLQNLKSYVISIFGSKTRAYAALAVIGFLALGIIASFIVLRIVLYKQSKAIDGLATTDQDDIGDDKNISTVQWTLRQFLLNMPFSGQISLVVAFILGVAILCIRTFIFTLREETFISNTLNSSLIIVLVLNGIATIYGLWQLGFYSSLALTMMLTGPPFVWYVLLLVVWIVLGTLSLYKKDSKLLQSAILLLPASFFVGALGSVGGMTGVVGCLLLLLGYAICFLAVAVLKKKGLNYLNRISLLEYLRLFLFMCLLSGTIMNIYSGTGYGIASFCFAFFSGIALLWGHIVKAWNDSSSSGSDSEGFS